MSVNPASDTDQRPDLDERMARDGIRITITDRSNGGFSAFAPSSMWRVVVRSGNRTLRLPYYTIASLDAPTAVDVMCDLITTALSIEDSSTMNEWAGIEPGEIPDIKSQHTYYWSVEQTDRLRYVLGDRYDDYLRNTKL